LIVNLDIHKTRGKTEWLSLYWDNAIYHAMDLLKGSGLDELAEAVTVLFNTTMVAACSEHLGARPLRALRKPFRLCQRIQGQDSQNSTGRTPLRVP
jgi:hypothetical protein